MSHIICPMQATDLLVFRKPFQTLFISFKGVNTCTPHVPWHGGLSICLQFPFCKIKFLRCTSDQELGKQIHCSMFNSFYMSKNKFSHSLNIQIYARLEYKEQYDTVVLNSKTIAVWHILWWNRHWSAFEYSKLNRNVCDCAAHLNRQQGAFSH